ncbi:2540_t:CDS:1 [Diversispora eburnea]|uniref:2540_t:CDS:1 n=1 Tax=Diversispora eburnea TaxID=1213867 RepID=A0A9N9F1X0_9GLOM|nr:2540_t:CDS:1 [Diversispora eburnea]
MSSFSANATNNHGTSKNNTYIQIKPNKMVRAELLQRELAKAPNPKYIRTKPNVIVRAEMANNSSGSSSKYANTQTSTTYSSQTPMTPYRTHGSYNSFRPQYNYTKYIKSNNKYVRQEVENNNLR